MREEVLSSAESTADGLRSEVATVASRARTTGSGCGVV